MDSPLDPLEKNTGPAKTLILVQEDPCQTSDLQNQKIINLYCFKPLSFGNLLQEQQETNTKAP